MECHVKATVFLVKGNSDCCEHFPTCDCNEHNEWVLECPECGGKAKSKQFLGLYTCTACDQSCYPLVEGWVDKRNG